jgi:hypothetical protein
MHVRHLQLLSRIIIFSKTPIIEAQSGFANGDWYTVIYRRVVPARPLMRVSIRSAEFEQGLYGYGSDKSVKPIKTSPPE